METTIKNTKEKKQAKNLQRELYENEIVSKYMKLLEANSKSEATELVASEYNVSIPYIYTVRKRVASRLTPQRNQSEEDAND